MATAANTQYKNGVFIARMGVPGELLLRRIQMNVFIRIKAAGKRRDMLESREKIIADDIDTPEKLIAYLVRENVRAYNAKGGDAPFFHYLSQRELDDGAYTGKVGFGDRKNEKQQDEDEAVQNAVQCFYDGIYRILINENEVVPRQKENTEAQKTPFIQEGDKLTFIRLVMLAGRMF
jgi:hypothetical protein